MEMPCAGSGMHSRPECQCSGTYICAAPPCRRGLSSITDIFALCRAKQALCCSIRRAASSRRLWRGLCLCSWLTCEHGQHHLRQLDLLCEGWRRCSSYGGVKEPLFGTAKDVCRQPAVAASIRDLQLLQQLFNSVLMFISSPGSTFQYTGSHLVEPSCQVNRP